MSASDGVNPDSRQIDRITAELLRARSRQKRVYILLASGLLVGILLALTIITFSNATVIEVQPEEAQERAVLRVESGFGTTIGHSLYSLTGNPTVEVSAAGYISQLKTISSLETGTIVKVELSEKPGLLQIRTLPASASTRWLVDGKSVAIGESLQQELFAGEYAVEIDNPYYLKQNIPVSMERDKILAVDVELQPVDGELKINSKPAGAAVRINGELVGVSPLSLSKPGGKYRIEIEHGDFQSIIEEAEITNSDKLIERDYRLALKDATLHLDLSPSGGTLLLNGKAVHISDTITIKAAVINSLSYHKAGYFSQRHTLTVAPGLEKKLSLKLKAELGKVSFFSTPAATVNLDGKDVGQTPLVLQLPAVPHHLELHKKGYRSYQRRFTPSSRSAQQVRVSLQTNRQAKLAESPDRYTSQVGLEFKMFRPAERFIMGAPRHEKGQRANEFLRSVELNMPFYTSMTEVTRGQYSRFKPVQGASSEPVTSLRWIEAAQFCNWLSQQERRPAFYDIRAGELRGFNPGSDGYRLLSEAEWEWLARKASKTEQSRFTWGDETTIPDKAGNIADESGKGVISKYVPNYSDGFASLAPVASYPLERSGLYDLTGNVSEWVHDVYALLPVDGQSVERNPLGPRVGDTHTVKGSNWRSGSLTELRASFREGEKNGRDDIGFRVARYVFGGADEQ